MNARSKARSRFAFNALALSTLALHAAAMDIPFQLPAPDGKAGDAGKPVKVYILSGQSNMVGMGDIKGAQPPWPSVMLSADPAILPGVMPVGQGRNSWGNWVGVSALAAHGIYRSADPKAEKGAVVSLISGGTSSRT
jgi:hypothetical protein